MGTVVFSKTKSAGSVIPVAVATTVKLPMSWLAVSIGAVAIPKAFVSTVARALNDPVAPKVGTANVTGTFSQTKMFPSSPLASRLGC